MPLFLLQEVEPAVVQNAATDTKHKTRSDYRNCCLCPRLNCGIKTVYRVVHQVACCKRIFSRQKNACCTHQYNFCVMFHFYTSLASAVVVNDTRKDSKLAVLSNFFNFPILHTITFHVYICYVTTCTNMLYSNIYMY